MQVSRRDVLRALAAVGVVPGLGLRNAAFAAEHQTSGMLVVLHLRGGCDGLNLLSPASDPDFIAARSSELRVLEEGVDAGHAVPHVQSGAPEFRLHADAHGLAELVEAKHLAFVHAAGLTDATRSHFVATDLIEHGVADGAALNRSNSGWLARAMQGTTSEAVIRAVSTAGSLSGAWSGDADVVSIADLSNGLAPPGGPQTATVLQALYRSSGTNSAVTIAGANTLAALAAVDARLPRDAKGKYAVYSAENGANYDAANEFGRPLKALAQLIKMDLGLQAATVDLGGWDMHEYQAGRFRAQVTRLSQGLSAFYNDLARYQDRLTVVVVTEFGRRLRSNRSNGTDHGRGSVMMVLGSRVSGGRIHGHWPGLKSEQLDEGVDLAVANDYRAVLTEVVGQWRPQAAPLFPGAPPQEKLGLFI